MIEEAGNQLGRELWEIITRPRTVPPMPFVHLGASDSPVTTEMLVTGNQLKSSLNLMEAVSETWLAVLIDRMTHPAEYPIFGID